MRSVNLLPRSIIERIELNRFILRGTAILAVIFLLSILLVYALDMSAGILRGEIDGLLVTLSDEKYAESDRIAEEIKERRAEGREQPVPVESTEEISTEAVMLLSRIMQGQAGDQFIQIESIICDSAKATEIIGITSDRGLISDLVRELYNENKFAGIDVPRVTLDGNGIYRFRLILRN